VTDEFVAHIRAAQRRTPTGTWGRRPSSCSSQRTLLDLKAARLLPQPLRPTTRLRPLEARDLLFARLLQYRAFKDIARAFADRMATAAKMTARQAGLEPQFASLLPELVMGITPEQLAMVAARALTPKAPPTVGLEHLHVPQVSVREQAALLVDRLRRDRMSTFRDLVADADETIVIVARFLALLELFKEGAIAFDQPERWGRSRSGGRAVTRVRWT
jgi:segregation and condensation protein A